jgi:hypothetical protein
LLTANYRGSRPSRTEPVANLIHCLLDPLWAAEFAIKDSAPPPSTSVSAATPIRRNRA